MAMILQAGATATIRKVGFRVSTVNVAGDVDVRLETIDATNGEPTGTLLDASATKTVTISAAGWITADFGAGNGAAVTQGDKFAVVIQDNASSAPEILISLFAEETRFPFPYLGTYISSWSLSSTNAAIVALEDSTGAYMRLLGVLPVKDFNTHVFGNGSTPDHRGLKFQVPFKCRVVGGYAWFDGDGDADIKLYDSDGTTVLDTHSTDKDVRGRIEAGIYVFWFDSGNILTINTDYRLVVEPTSATSIRYHDMTVDSAAILDTLPGGQNFHGTTKKDAGWTDTTTIRPFIGLILDQLDDGAGAGGGGGPLIGGRLVG
jgi:hypothetical protein